MAKAATTVFTDY